MSKRESASSAVSGNTLCRPSRGHLRYRPASLDRPGSLTPSLWVAKWESLAELPTSYPCLLGLKMCDTDCPQPEFVDRYRFLKTKRLSYQLSKPPHNLKKYKGSKPLTKAEQAEFYRLEIRVSTWCIATIGDDL